MCEDVRRAGELSGEQKEESRRAKSRRERKSWQSGGAVTALVRAGGPAVGGLQPPGAPPPAAPSLQQSETPAVQRSAVPTPSAPRCQQSSSQRSRRLQPLDTSGPQRPAVPRHQRTEVPMPAAPGHQRSQDVSGPEMPTAPSHQQPRRKMPHHAKPRMALFAAVASSGWQPCRSGIVGSRVCVIWVVLLVIVAVIVASSSLGAALSCPEWPLLGSSLVRGATSSSSGLVLGVALFGVASSWERIGSWSGVICGAASSGAAFLGVTLLGSSSLPFHKR